MDEAVSRQKDDVVAFRRREAGDSLRKIGADLGVNPSTVMRRSQRGHDALEADAFLGEAMDMQPEDHTQEAKRILRRLSEAGATLIVGDGMDKAIVMRLHRRTAITSRAAAGSFLVNGWISLRESTSQVTTYGITDAGRAALREILGQRSTEPATEILFRKGILTQEHMETVDWLRQSNPEPEEIGKLHNCLASIVRLVCLQDQYIEASEKQLGWPRRSGKLVLQIALDELRGKK